MARLKTTIASTLSSAHTQYHASLLKRAHFKLKNTATCEDAVQTTFLKTWLYLLQGRKVVAMKAFLYHILNNLVIDEYRKKKDISLEALLEKGYDPAVDYYERLVNNFDGQMAMSMIGKIPPKYQLLMYMKYAEGLSITEIATITGKTKNAVAVEAHRGLMALRALYLHNAPPPIPDVSHTHATVTGTHVNY